MRGLSRAPIQVAIVVTKKFHNREVIGISVRSAPSLAMKENATLKEPSAGEQDALRSWLCGFLDHEFVKQAALRVDISPENCRSLLETFTNEALTYAPLVFERLGSGVRVLEVGSGLGFLSLWLRRQGVDVVGLEPAAGPHDVFAGLSTAVIEHAGEPDAPILQIPAEQLDPSIHGKFDFVYSVNVLEHIADLEGAVAAMAGVLAPGGAMLHVCPNYVFPYEPHLGIPLIPGRPAATAYLFPGVVRRHRQIWQTLNFVTAYRLRRAGRCQGLGVRLLPGQLHAQILRLRSDPLFRARHLNGGLGPLIAAALRIGSVAGLFALLRRFPPSLQSPMIAEMTASTVGNDPTNQHSAKPLIS